VALARLGSSVLDVLQVEMETEFLSSYSLDVDESQGDAEECVDELGLADYVAFWGATDDPYGSSASANPLRSPARPFGRPVIKTRHDALFE
jgi:hypothetical protein